VTEFVNKKSPGTTYGAKAAEAFSSALGKSGEFDVVPADTVKRATENLSISSPPDGLVNLLRLGQEVSASSIVKGEIASYQVSPTGSGKQASIVMRIVVYDVGSGLPVNGAALKGVSAIRSGSVSDDSLIQDAILQAANEAVNQIKSHRLPVGTVLNTQENKALINKGARAGFTSGQEVIVLRNREQVATARVTEVEPDSAYIVASNIQRGIQPGDRIRVVFKVPDVDVDPAGDIHVHPVRNTSFPSGLVSVALVLGVVVALVGAGNGGSQDTVSNVAARATMYPNEAGIPAVHLTWSPNAFAGGNSQRAAWQIWRNDVLDSPIGVANGLSQDYTDALGNTFAIGALDYAVFQANQAGFNQVCNYAQSFDSANTIAVPSIAVGQQYIYQVQEVYDLLSIDLPGGSSSQTSGGTSTASTASGSTASGSTATGSTGTGTTGTTGTSGSIGGTTGTTGTTGTGTTSTAGTTGTTTGGGQLCYFLTSKVTAVGLATPLNVPVLGTPLQGQSLNGATNFSTTSVLGTTSPITVQYVLEFSSTINFAKGTFFQVANFFSNQTGTIQNPGSGIDPGVYFPNASQTTPIYWRYGARNIADVPGPAPDALTHEPFIFCPPRTFFFTGTPPPPPKAKKGTNTKIRVGKGKAG